MASRHDDPPCGPSARWWLATAATAAIGGLALAGPASATPTSGEPTPWSFYHDDAVKAQMLPWTQSHPHKKFSYPAPAGKQNDWYADKGTGGIQQVRGAKRERLYTELLARTPQGTLPDAPAVDPDISWDQRNAQYMSYTSAATNILPGPQTVGQRNVYLVERTRASHGEGSPWEIRSTKLISRAADGGPADGDSWSARLPGSQNQKARRIAFVSAASNLVSGDDNGRPDVFVRSTSGSRMTRIPSRSKEGASEVAIAGQRAMRGEEPALMWVDGGDLWFLDGSKWESGKKKVGKPKRLAKGGVSRPDMTYTGVGYSFEKDGWVWAGDTRKGKPRKIARGAHSSVDGGAFWKNRRPFGEVRYVTYERDGHVYNSYVGTKYNSRTKKIDYKGGRKVRTDSGFAGRTPATATGGPQVLFSHGPFVYGWLTNQKDIKQAQTVCPVGTGDVTDLQVSHTWNYIAFSCSGGALYFSYLGPFK
ncbi:MAG: hypothetical protein M0P31_04395 [Solirubrobacteraceae bacterium]|nr:hypothetical protein [Solirubrobacteraceae bacterium]